MFQREELENALDIHRRAYRLLRWVEEAIEKGFISFTCAHDYASASESARDWVEEHYENIPEDCRPSRALLEPFANYFSSYVTTSFEMVEEPEEVLKSDCGCYCSMCTYLGQAPRLQPVKVRTRDKEKAREKCAQRVQVLAGEEGIQVSEEDCKIIAGTQRRNSAFSAYAQSLFQRMNGTDGGVHVLALWRMIAWKPEGSPIKGFELQVDEIVSAEKELVSALNRVESMT
ncbi:MAG: hypothetical protein AAGF67_08705 [Verrucomicrobiota bacterium]